MTSSAIRNKKSYTLWKGEKMNKSFFRLIVFILFLLFSLNACTSNQFPTGLFEHELIKGFVLEIDKDSTWAYYVNNMLVASGTYAIDGQEFIIETDEINGSINPNYATYTWSYHNGILSLRLKGKNNPPECFRNLSEKTGARYLELLQSLDA
jgi:hypothetical protein